MVWKVLGGAEISGSPGLDSEVPESRVLTPLTALAALLIAAQHRSHDTA
jgi:hypothetical protein